MYQLHCNDFSFSTTSKLLVGINDLARSVLPVCAGGSDADHHRSHIGCQQNVSNGSFLGVEMDVISKLNHHHPDLSRISCAIAYTNS